MLASRAGSSAYGKERMSGNMKKMAELNMRIALLVLWLCPLASFAYAGGPVTFDRETGEGRFVRSVPVAELNNAKDEILPPRAPNSAEDSMTFLRTTSTVSEGQDKVEEKTAPDQTPPVFKKQPSEQEVGVLVDAVLSHMTNAGHGADLSQALTYVSTGNYVSLTELQKANPEILGQFISSLQKVSEEHSGDATSQNYMNDWIHRATQLQNNLNEQQPGATPDTLVETVKKLYEPISKRISEVTQSIQEAGRAGGKESSSGDLLKNFSGKAKDFILDSLNRAQTNLANGMLSNPLEATAFASEAAPALISGDALKTREMTMAEVYTKSRGRGKYQVMDSVYIGKNFIYAQKMLHPPTNLHPYLKWLLYTRNLTPQMVESYLATREAVGAIYEQAKAGRGNIRYRGNVYGAFLPFAETATGNYELVKPASAQ